MGVLKAAMFISGGRFAMRIALETRNFSSWSSSPQTIVITGGSRGIGLGVAKTLANECKSLSDVDFLLVSQHMERLDKGKKIIIEDTSFPRDRIHLLEADLGKIEGVQRVNEVFELGTYPFSNIKYKLFYAFLR